MGNDVAEAKKYLEENDRRGFIGSIEKEVKKSGPTKFLKKSKKICDTGIKKVEKGLNSKSYPGFRDKVAVFDRLFNETYIMNKIPFESIMLFTEYMPFDSEFLSGWIYRSSDLLERVDMYSSIFEEQSTKNKIQLGLDLYELVFEDVKKMLDPISFTVALRAGQPLDEKTNWKKKLDALYQDDEVKSTLEGFNSVIRNAKAHNSYKINENKGTIIFINREVENEYKIEDFIKRLCELMELYYALFVSMSKMASHYYELFIGISKPIEKIWSKIDRKDLKELQIGLLGKKEGSLIEMILENKDT